MGPRFGKNQTTPQLTPGQFQWAIYNTTYQFLIRVKDITYLRASWGIADLTFWSKEEKKKKSQDQAI